MQAADDLDGVPGGIGQLHDDPAQHLGQRAYRGPGLVGQPHHVDLVGGTERHAGEPGAGTATQADTRRSGVGTPQPQLRGVTDRHTEPERSGERLGTHQVGFVEFQPGNVGNPDQRVT